MGHRAALHLAFAGATRTVFAAVWQAYALTNACGQNGFVCVN
jgi:hypothetical protein